VAPLIEAVHQQCDGAGAPREREPVDAPRRQLLEGGPRPIGRRHDHGSERVDRALHRGRRPGPPQAPEGVLPEHVDAPVEPEVAAGGAAPAHEAQELVGDVVLLDVELEALAPGEGDADELVGR
jgi:hypothetical protein